MRRRSRREWFVVGWLVGWLIGCWLKGCKQSSRKRQQWLVGRNVVRKSVRAMSEVGFEPTPTEVDCDLNAAP